jgi:aryl-alcohol dehydrogenase-like predicted oxidoreductase
MRYRTIGSSPATRREVSVLSLGAMLMGSRTDEATSFAILDRYVEAGGTFIDTSGTYAFWVNGTQGGEIPVVPLVGASSVAQLDESLAAVDLELTAEQRARLDEAG